MAHTGETINGSSVKVQSADVWSNTTVTNSGGLELNAAGANAYDTTLSNEAYLWLQNSGYASGVNVGNGSCRVSAYNTGVVVENVHVDSGVNAVARPRLDVRNGATVRGAVVSGAYVQVTGGTNAKIYDVTLDLSAQMRVYNAAYGSGITLSHTGCDLKVYQNNASVTDLTVLGGIASAYQTGKITNATIGDRLHVSSAGYASGVQLLSNGTAFINGADALIEDVHINAGGSNAAAYPNLDIRVGSAVNVVASGAAIQVTGASAFISGVTMEQNATLVVWNSAVARDITNSSGTFRVWGGANASNATIYGKMEVSSAGVASSVDLYGTNAGGATSVAYIAVSAGGRIADVVVSGGRLDVSSGAAAENVTVSAGYGMVVRGATVTNCSAVGSTGNNYIFVQQGATLSGGYFADNGRLRLEAGCSATDLVFENSIANANFIIDTGAHISGYTLRGDTLLDLRGTALNGTVSGGTLSFTSGGTLTGLVVSNGGNFNFGTTGDITGVTIKAGGKLFGKFSWDHDFTIATIADGTATVADNVTVTSARMDVKADGVASGATISGGNAVVSAGGTFESGTLLGNNTGGATNANYAIVYAGGKISDTVVSGFRVDVSAGASAENIAVTYGYGLVVRGATVTNASAVGTAAANYIFIQQAATLSGGYFTAKGELRVDGGCSATDVVFDNGGATIIGNGAYTSKLTIRGANANIGYAGTVLDATVSGGALNFSSGTMTGLTVSAGAAKISSGGVVTGLTVSAGNAQVFGGGAVNGADVKSGATLYASKGTVENVTLELGGTLSVRDGGYASGVSGNGYVETYTGTISSAVMANGSSFRVYAPGYAQDVWIDNTEVVVRGEGAVLSNAYISGGKITSIQNYGIARNLTRVDGRLRIDINGTAAGTVSGATLTNVLTEIFDKGELSGFVAAGNSTVVNTGAKLLDGTALSGNRIDVMGGYASHITVSSGAQIWVSSGGMITDLSLQGAYAEVNAGGNISGATVASNVARADFRVLNGFAEEVNLTGGIVVIRGANASAANISATGNGNTVHAQASGRIDGVKIESGAQLLINSQGGAVGGSVFSATLNNAKTNVHHQGYISGFTAVGGSMLVDSGAKVFDGSMAAGEIILNAGAQMVDVAATDGTTITFVKDGSLATFVGSRTAFDEGALTYISTAVAGAARNGVISGLNANGAEFRIGVGDGITVKDAVLDNANARISAFTGATVDGVYVTAGAVICNAGASGTMKNVTLDGADAIMNLSGTAQADNTVVKAGGKLSLNTANVKIENTTLMAGGTVNITAGADTGASFTLAFDNAAATMNVDLSKLAGSTTVYATGVEAVGTYNLGSAGSVAGVTQKWGLYENAIAAGGSYADALNGVTYGFDGTAITTTALTVTTEAAAALTAYDTFAGGGDDRAAKWTSGAGATLVTESFNGDAWLEVAGDVTGAIYGASVDFANTVNVNAKSGTIRNLAAGAEAGKSVGAVKLTFDGADLAGAGYAGGFGNVTGETETLINDGSFAKDFYAGALANKLDSATSVGDVSMTIADGTFSGNIYGASAVKTTSGVSGTRHTADNVTLTVTGGETTKGNQACIFAGGYATGEGTGRVYTVASVTAEIAGGSWGAAAGGRGVFGGVMASGVEAAVTGDVNLTITGGEMGNVYGGGWAQKTNGKSIVGDVNIVIAGGTVANVFGGGSHSTSGGATVAGDVTITVSGGTITGAIFARGQLDGDTTGAASVTFTGAEDFGCNVYGYSYVGGAVGGATLTYNGYTGTFGGKVGGFDSIAFNDGTAMTLTTAAADVSNGKWEFDLSTRADALAGTSLLTWSNADFENDKLIVKFADDAQALANWSIADVAGSFTGATFDLWVNGGEFLTDLAYGEAISGTGSDYDGMGFTLENGTLKFAHITA